MEINKMHFDTIDSTNTYAKENAVSLPLPTLITAYKQTKGRGRHGKSFYSEKGGIYFSVLFKANENFDLITPACAVSVYKSIKELCGIETDIKWVNDLYFQEKKICGILVERFIKNDIVYTCAGIGINLNTETFPSDLTMAGSIKTNIDGKAIAEKATEYLLKYNENYNRNELLKEYDNRLFIKGKEISYSINNEEFTGNVIGINNDCNLIVENSKGNTDILSSGEISIKIK